MSLNPQIKSIHKISESEYIHQEHPISLKTLTIKDLNDFMEWASSEEVTKWLLWNQYTSRADAEVFFREVVEQHPWFKAICLGDKVIGSVTLDQRKGAHSCTAELGYVIARKYWGKGLGTRAVHLAIQHAFKDLEIKRIEAYVDPTNIGSQRILEKNGFIKEGLLKNFILQKGALKDRFIYALLKPF